MSEPTSSMCPIHRVYLAHEARPIFRWDRSHGNRLIRKIPTGSKIVSWCRECGPAPEEGERS